MSSPIPTARDLEIKSARRRRWFVGGAILALAIMAGTLSLIAFAYIEQSDKVEALETQNQEILDDHHAIGTGLRPADEEARQSDATPRGRGSIVVRPGLRRGSGSVAASASDPATCSSRCGGIGGPAPTALGSRFRAAHQGRRRRVRGALARARALREPYRSAQRVDEAGSRRRPIANPRQPSRPPADRPERRDLCVARERRDVRAYRAATSRAAREDTRHIDEVTCPSHVRAMAPGRAAADDVDVWGDSCESWLPFSQRGSCSPSRKHRLRQPSPPPN